MAQLGMTVDGVEDLLRRMSQLPPSIQKKYLAAAVRAAAKDEVKEVRQLTPRGPTGNLKRSVGLVVEKRRKARTATAVLGYRRSGNNKSTMGFHAAWIEEGVSDRYPRGKAFRVSMDRIKRPTIQGNADGFAYLASVRGFPGSGKFRAWADANLPQIRDRLQSVLGEYVDKAIAENERRQIRKIGK
jgi:hypothetical protein